MEFQDGVREFAEKVVAKVCKWGVWALECPVSQGVWLST